MPADRPDRDAWIATAERVAAPLAARADEIEARRSLPPDIADTLADAGLCALLTPRACGGHELHVGTFFEAIEAIARHEASTAWCSFIACTASVLAAWLPDDEARRSFGPRTKAAGVFAPRGRALAAERHGVAGWRVSGRWAWGSGAHNADVVSGGCLVIGADGQPQTLPGGAPRVLSVLFDRADVRLLDNWDTLGLRGTGSGEFEVEDVFVPAGRAASLFDPPRQPGALYRFPVFGLLAVGIAATASGIARHAIDAFVDLAAAKVPQGYRKVLAERAATQEAVARAEAEWRAARAFLLQAIDAAWACAATDGAIPVEHRRDLRLATTHAVHAAAAVAGRMYTLGGGSAVFAASPLQRCLRDAHVATQHMMVGEATYELAGRLFLGLPSDTSML